MLMEFSNEEIDLLTSDGYEPGFIGDIREGDLVAIPPVTRTNFHGELVPVDTYTVKRIMPVDASYWQPEEEKMVRNVVINFIGIDINNRVKHCAYGHTYPCFFKRVNG